MGPPAESPNIDFCYPVNLLKVLIFYDIEMIALQGSSEARSLILASCSGISVAYSITVVEIYSKRSGCGWQSLASNLQFRIGNLNLECLVGLGWYMQSV